MFRGQREQAWPLLPSRRPCHSCPAAPSGQRSSSLCCSIWDWAPCLVRWKGSSLHSQTASKPWPTTRPNSQVSIVSGTCGAVKQYNCSYLSRVPRWVSKGVFFFHVAVFSCVVGFLLGLPFTQRCGNYFVLMFDDYSATLPLIIVVVFETFSVSWLYGADRFALFLFIGRHGRLPF